MPNGLSAALSALDRPLSDKEILDVIKTTGQLNVWTCTWNMHAKTWPENLRKELKIASSKRVNHLYVMGTQECQRSIVSSAFLPSKWMWENALVKCFGERYVLVRSETMQALHVVVFVHRAILPFLKLVTTGSVPTGIRIKPTNVRLGNKGGVGIKFCLGKTNFVFVTCHLSAHQHRVQRRNQDFREINSLMNTKLFESEVKGLKNKSNILYSILTFLKRGLTRRRVGSKVAISNRLTSNQNVHHQIWLGDFNYRIDHNDPEVVIKTINSGQYESLLKRDQLTQERLRLRKQGDTVPFPGGLVEGQVKFKPTYKFDPNTDNYARKKRRVPSWTDRILYMPNSSDQNRTKLVYYDSLNHVRTSDHRPVVAMFKCDVVLE